MTNSPPALHIYNVEDFAAVGLGLNKNTAWMRRQVNNTGGILSENVKSDLTQISLENPRSFMAASEGHPP